MVWCRQNNATIPEIKLIMRKKDVWVKKINLFGSVLSYYWLKSNYFPGKVVISYKTISNNWKIELSLMKKSLTLPEKQSSATGSNYLPKKSNYLTLKSNYSPPFLTYNLAKSIYLSRKINYQGEESLLW